MSPVPQQRSSATVSGCWRMRPEETGGAGPPPAVDADGEEMVGAVVGGGDGVEHLLDVRGGGALVGGAGGAGSGGEFMFGLRAVRHRTMLDGFDESSMDSVAARSSGSVTSRTISVLPMAVGRTKDRLPLRFFLSREVRATSFSAVALKCGSGP